MDVIIYLRNTLHAKTVLIRGTKYLLASIYESKDVMFEYGVYIIQ